MEKKEMIVVHVTSDNEYQTLFSRNFYAFVSARTARAYVCVCVCARVCARARAHTHFLRVTVKFHDKKIWRLITFAKCRMFVKKNMIYFNFQHF